MFILNIFNVIIIAWMIYQLLIDYIYDSIPVERSNMTTGATLNN